MKNLEELATLDVYVLPDDLFSPASRLALRDALLQLDLQLWLREGGVEELLPQLVRAGHTSRHSLLALDPPSLEKVGQVASSLLASPSPSILSHPHSLRPLSLSPSPSLPPSLPQSLPSSPSTPPPPQSLLTPSPVLSLPLSLPLLPTSWFISCCQ